MQHFFSTYMHNAHYYAKILPGENMTLQEIILDYKKRSGLSTSQIALKLGVARSTVMRWEKGEVTQITSKVCTALSKTVGFDVSPLLKGNDGRVKIPVVGYVKGGYDMFAQENYLGEEDASLAEKQLGDYYLKVEGSSMVGVGIMPGSLVLVRSTTHIESGKIAVILIGDEVTVKRFILKNRMVILEAANPDVENRYFTPQEVKTLPVRVIGEVISIKTYL